MLWHSISETARRTETVALRRRGALIGGGRLCDSVGRALRRREAVNGGGRLSNSGGRLLNSGNVDLAETDSENGVRKI